MDDVAVVQVADALAHLVKQPLRHLVLQLSARPLFEEMVERAATNEVHDKVDLLWRIQCLMEDHDIRMPEALHEPDLAPHAFSALRIEQLVLLVDFDGDLAARLLVKPKTDYGVGALADLLADDVILDGVAREDTAVPVAVAGGRATAIAVAGMVSALARVPVGAAIAVRVPEKGIDGGVAPLLLPGANAEAAAAQRSRVTAQVDEALSVGGADGLWGGGVLRPCKHLADASLLALPQATARLPPSASRQGDPGRSADVERVKSSGRRCSRDTGRALCVASGGACPCTLRPADDPAQHILRSRRARRGVAGGADGSVGILKSSGALAGRQWRRRVGCSAVPRGRGLTSAPTGATGTTATATAWRAACGSTHGSPDSVASLDRAGGTR
mmetsp:Transcript_89684/g.232506  ORF Transcript_89684/g.232506 Transcript_89684/m.232506 type:complete len:387 (+) Transcript_89684:624-1784(+)